MYSIWIWFAEGIVALFERYLSFNIMGSSMNVEIEEIRQAFIFCRES
jgi:hypothetical protein